MNYSEVLVIGVDAGGSKTTAWIAKVDDSSSEPLGVGEAGPGNPRAVGFKAAQQEIRLAISRAFENAAFVRSTVESLCLSAAGAGRSAEQAQLREWAESLQLANRIVVTGDAEPILAAASPESTGIALICGTGSLAWGRNAAGCIDRTGGWGPLFGDEGSAYLIALSGLRAAARAGDGRGPETALLDAFQQRLDAATPSALIERVYGAALTRKQIAACVDVVFAAAKSDDVASRIISVAAIDLADMVSALAVKLSLPPMEFSLALAGGVLMHQPEFRSSVVRSAGVDSQQIVLVPEPVVGAISIARRLAAK